MGTILGSVSPNSMASSSTPSVQTFGKKKTATAVAFCKAGKGQIRVNGVPLNLVEPEILRMKVYEPLLVCIRGAATTAGGNPFEAVDIKVRVNGGGHTSQVYAIRQALARAVVAYTGKYNDAASALELRKTLIAFVRTLLVSDPRRCEPKKFGGPGARARYQKSYRQRLSPPLICPSFVFPSRIPTYNRHRAARSTLSLCPALPDCLSSWLVPLLRFTRPSLAPSQSRRPLLHLT